MSRFVYLFGFVLAGFLALGMFQAKTGASESAREIRELEQEITRLDKELAVLEQEYDMLAAPARIARLAAQELGMGPARSYQMVEASNAQQAFGPLNEYEDAE